MLMRLYTVYDRVAQESAPVACCVNDGVALRQYRAALQQVSPTDQDAYQLYCIGTMDMGTMEIIPCVPSLVEVPDLQMSISSFAGPSFEKEGGKK